MCNRTDCAGSWAGPMACAVCRERDMEMTELSHNMRQALIDLDAPYCDASVYWTKNTMAALEKRGLVFRRDNGITWSWEVTPEGRTFLKESGTSGCATCDDLRAENAALRDRVEALEKWETSASCCVICNNSPADKITLHETDAPWEIYAPFEVCLCREHQRALIAGVQEAVKKMKEERDAQISA